MNEKQKRRLEWLKKEIMEHDGLGRHKNNYEYKKWEVTEQYRKKLIWLRDNTFEWVNTPVLDVYLMSIVGQKNDEGTQAEVFCRQRRCIKIGPRGGMVLVNAKQKSRGKGTAVVHALTWD